MKQVLAVLALMGGVLPAACGDASGPNGALLFSREITAEEFQHRLVAGPVRLEIELLTSGLVAREIEIRNSAEFTRREEIESRITAASASSLTLALGDLTIGFAPGARFRDESGDLTGAAFLSRVETALAGGVQPPVEVRRQPAPTPQDPGDATFMATELRLDDEADEPEIEINADGDNLGECSALAVPPPGCLATVRVLGLTIAIVRGVTELESQVDDLEGEVDFEGLVRAVDVTAGSVTLHDGTVIRLVAGTELETESGDHDQLKSLAEVEAALAAGLFVEADGKGVVESLAPLTIVAIEIEFEVEDDLDNMPGGGG
jgi:hypothetical protein